MLGTASRIPRRFLEEKPIQEAHGWPHPVPLSAVRWYALHNESRQFACILARTQHWLRRRRCGCWSTTCRRSERFSTALAASTVRPISLAVAFTANNIVVVPIRSGSAPWRQSQLPEAHRQSPMESILPAGCKPCWRRPAGRSCSPVQESVAQHPRAYRRAGALSLQRRTLISVKR